MGTGSLVVRIVPARTAGRLFPYNAPFDPTPVGPKSFPYSLLRTSAPYTIRTMSDPVPIDFSNAWKSGARIVNSVISLLPNLVIALFIFVAVLILASAAKSMVRRISVRRQRHQNLAILLGQLVQTLVLILGFLVAFSVVAPSFHAANLIQMLGIGTVAIGFAFQNILQNFLAGVLLLVQEPFDIGDWISVTRTSKARSTTSKPAPP